MPLINCKIHLELSWNKNCLLSSADANNLSFKITKTQLYVPIVTLLKDDNEKLIKQLNEGFKRTVQWNDYNVKFKEEQSTNTFIKLLDASIQGANRLFVLAFNNVEAGDDDDSNTDNRVQRDGNRKYFLLRIEINNYNVLFNGRNFYDQPIIDQTRKYDFGKR